MIVGRTLLPLPNPQRLLRENVHANVKGRKRTRQPKRCLFGRDNNDKEVVNKIIEMKISSFLLLACFLAVCPKSLTWKYLSHRQFANEISLTQFIQNLFVLGHLMDITRKVTVLIWDMVSPSSLLPLSTQACWIQLQLDKLLGSLQTWKRHCIISVQHVKQYQPNILTVGRISCKY